VSIIQKKILRINNYDLLVTQKVRHHQIMWSTFIVFSNVLILNIFHKIIFPSYYIFEYFYTKINTIKN
jgi:hypothetical protein